MMAMLLLALRAICNYLNGPWGQVKIYFGQMLNILLWSMAKNKLIIFYKKMVKNNYFPTDLLGNSLCCTFGPGMINNLGHFMKMNKKNV